jgi:hypothetical protein
MPEQNETDSQLEIGLVTRRTVLAGLMTAALTPVLIEGAAPALADGAHGSSAAPGSMLMPRGFHTVTELHGGKLLVAGGLGPGNRSLSSVTIYDPARDAWQEAASMAMPRFQHAAVLLWDGRVLVTGGLNRNTYPLHGAEIYDPGTDSWSSTEPMIMPRYGHTMSLLSSRQVLVMGGIHGASMASIEILSLRD